ncbi:MAG: S-layer homology domain-containing protein [Phascolarctobacterium sp.]|nr:S-layer homology domain-containing protein [Phascolarctobacterium sp.]
MKKSLVLAMAMALGVTASAYAANPFSDVPAGHWAYDSISKLAAAGVVEGYPDGSFKGENLMTRYEMAQIVAKAMAKGANVDALAAEFAQELDNLGVRVAALEKKVDNVKITGQVRYNYAKLNGGADADMLRTRLWIAGQVNEDWKYTAMLENRQNFKSSNKGEEGDVRFQRAYVDGKLGGLKVRAGRSGFTSWNALSALSFGGEIYDTRADYGQIQYGKDIQLTAAVGKLADATGMLGTGIGSDLSAGGDFWAVNVKGDLGKIATLNVGYYDLNDGGKIAVDKEIINVGLALKLNKDFKFLADWYKLNSDDDVIDGNQGWGLGVAIKGAKAAKPGSWGINAKYIDIEDGIMVSNGWNHSDGSSSAGQKGWAVGGYYTIAKNIVAGVEYYSTEWKTKADGHQETLWSQLVFTF